MNKLRQNRTKRFSEPPLTNRTCKGEIFVDQIQAPKFVASSNTDIFLISSIKVNDIKRRRHQFAQNSQRKDRN